MPAVSHVSVVGAGLAAAGVADQWGTANQMNEFVASKSFNEPDRGLFTAPPV